MKKVKKYVLVNIFILFLFLLLNELIIRVFVGNSFLDFSVIRIIISSFIISILFNLIVSFIKSKKINKIINIIFALIMSILSFVELGLYNYLGFFMGIGNSEQGTKVLSYFADFMKSYKLVHYLLFVPVIFCILYYLFFEDKLLSKYKIKRNVTKKQIKYISVFFVVISLIYYVSIRTNIMQNKLQVESNYYLWIYPENSNLSVNNYGVYMYLFSDIKSQIFGMNDEKALKYYSVNSSKNNGNRVGWSSIDDKKWKEIDNNTTDSNYNILNNYYMNRVVSSKNDMTGIFEGKNVIFILMESVNDVAILNKEYFPNIYKLYHEGISFTNNFSPRNNCSTGNNELSVLASMFTINNTCAANLYSDNTYFNAAFNMFKNEGYYASAYHNYSLMYYNRDEYMPKLGSEKYYGAKELGIHVTDVYGDWPEDHLLFEKSKDYYMNKDKFFTYFISVSSHQTYNVSSPTGDKYLKKYLDLGYSSNIGRYMSKVQILDEAIGVLLKQLEDSGKLDDTVLVLFGDHYPYGLTDKSLMEYFNKNNYEYTVSRNSTEDKNVDRTPVIIYNSELKKPIVVDEYTTIIDILPTVLNLMNIEYDSRLYMGTDVFSKEHKSRAVFADGSWQDENAFYYAPSQKINYFGNKKYSNNEIMEINVDISERKKMSSLVLKTDYFNYLDEQLKK